jgi:RNA polymerase sigma factor (sigma-70 family)
MRINKIPQKIENLIEAYSCCLTPKQKIILELKFCNRKKISEIAKILRLTEERIHQLQESAIKILIEKTKVVK